MRLVTFNPQIGDTYTNPKGLLFVIRDIYRSAGNALVIVHGEPTIFTLSEIVDAVIIGYWTLIN